MKIEINKENRQKLDSEIGKILAYCDEVKANPEQKSYVSYDEHYRSVDYIYNSIDNVRKLVYEVEDRFYDKINYFYENHTMLPKLSTSQLEKLLEVIGADKDFNVIKPYIIASEKQGNTLNIEIKKK